MVNAQDTQFAGFAGQLVPSGIGPNMPLVALEQGVDETVYRNLQNIQGLLPKIKDVFVRRTTIFTNPLDPYITRFDERYGAGIEQVAVKYGAYNEKRDGTCMPRGVPELTSQLNVENFALSVDIDIPDYLFDKAVLDDGQRGSITAALMDAPLKTIASQRYRAWVQLISDVIDGTRSITSKDSFNGYAAKGASATVTYNPNIIGYAGKVETIANVVMPMVQVGTQYTIPTARDALNIVNRLKSITADMRFESTEFNKLGIMNFVGSAPLLIAETKVLDAMDTVFAEANADGNGNNYGYAGFPTVSAREYIRSFADIVEIDSFASLPSNSEYTDQAVHFVLIDRDAFIEVVQNYSVEGMRCAKERSTGYNWRAEEVFSIWRGSPSYAMLFPTSGE